MTSHTKRVPFEPDALIGGRYRVISLIGVGGVGRVFLARHIELDTDVAMKVLRPEMAERPEAVQRFAREARASVHLQSERIARVFDVGTHEGTPYFVMEYLVGCDLLELRQRESIDTPTLCEFFIQACEGLADAHAKGVVHRDIKPENLFIVRDTNGWRSLKIFDFGISKVSLTGRYSDVDIASMRTELMMGTPHYISPEQIRSTRDVDHRTDLWSLGVVMFEVLSGGVLPFREEREVTALIAEVLEQPHRSLLDVAPNVPEGLAAIVDRCLTKDREQRYQSAAEIAVELLPFAPVRARASAERAVAAMQVAGLMAINADMGSLRPSQPPAADRVSRMTPVAKAERSGQPAALGEAKARVEAKALVEESEGPRRRPAGLVLGGLLAVALLALAMTLRTSEKPAQSAQASRPSPTVLPAPTALSAPPAPATPQAQASAAPAPSPSILPAPSNAPSLARSLATARPIVVPRPVAAPHPVVAPPPKAASASKSADSAPPKLDLVRER
jgi:serine/threonine-protein kinase